MQFSHILITFHQHFSTLNGRDSPFDILLFESDKKKDGQSFIGFKQITFVAISCLFN